MEQDEKKKRKPKRMTGRMQTTLVGVFCLFLVGLLIIMVRVAVVGGNTN